MTKQSQRNHRKNGQKPLLPYNSHSVPEMETPRHEVNAGECKADALTG